MAKPMRGLLATTARGGDPSDATLRPTRGFLLPARWQEREAGLTRPSSAWYPVDMCRNIKTLFNFEPPANEEEIRAASLQFVRKLSGTTRPSKANEAAFERAVDQVAEVARELLGSLVTTAPPKDRAAEAEAARARSAKRFGTQVGAGR